MEITFVTFDDILLYGGYATGIYNTIIALKSLNINLVEKNGIKQKIENKGIVHLTNFVHGTKYCSHLNKQFVHIHGFSVEIHPTFGDIEGKNNITKEQLDFLRRNKIIYSSEYQRDVFGIPGYVVWNCCSPAFAPRKRQRKGIISTINITYSKGIDRLKSDKYTIDVIGKRISDISRKDIEIPSNINCIGSFNNNKMPEILNKYKMFIHPSRLESCSIAIIEALSCGLPVIASNTGDNKKMIGDAGIILDDWDYLDNAIETIYDSYEIFKEKAIEQAKLFTPQKMGMKLLQVYFS